MVFTKMTSLKRKKNEFPYISKSWKIDDVSTLVETMPLAIRGWRGSSYTSGNDKTVESQTTFSFSIEKVTAPFKLGLKRREKKKTTAERPSCINEPCT